MEQPETPLVSIDFSNIEKNKKKSKDKSKTGQFNTFTKITELVKLYKQTNDDEDLLVIINACSGLINTYTICISPPSSNQQIFYTPYIKRFLGMFLNSDERGRYDVEIYNIALARVRWIMRFYTYEDVYAHVLYEMINTIKKSRIIGSCDIFYYYQHVLKYKLHSWCLKQSKDLFSMVVDTSVNPEDDSTNEEVIDRLREEDDGDFEESSIGNMFYDDIDLSILLETSDIWKCFSYYEKYLLFLKYGLSSKDGRPLKDAVILSILKFETKDELTERMEDILERMKLLNEENN